ncbi:potassium-transporting ATPase subunit KdpC [uncultured Friedmanniella sp.]|uniref:potassium-transporting ATPase subunit KdpC n=1 Tax=uncultured Friedmanniella sp. TaxID=335381 RepID=UPI0035CB56C1
MNFFRQALTGLRVLVVMTVVVGIAYPVVIWGVGQIAFKQQAEGSLITNGGAVVGSTLIGQTFAEDQWFASRPSAGDYDALASAGTNAGPSDTDLLAEIDKRRQDIAAREGVAPSDVPPDAVTTSASGLDAYISPEYARIQEARVARVRKLDPAKVASLVAAASSGRSLGFLGEPRVNVVKLNASLAAAG